MDETEVILDVNAGRNGWGRVIVWLLLILVVLAVALAAGEGLLRLLVLLANEANEPPQPIRLTLEGAGVGGVILFILAIAFVVRRLSGDVFGPGPK